MTTNPSLDWLKLNEKFYRKQTIFKMIWGDIDLSKHLCAAAPFGGPIALIINDKKIVAYQGQATKNVLHIYNNAGKLLTQIQWDKGTIITMGWTSDEKLACVLEQGMICLVEINGNTTQISLGEDAKEFGIHSAVVCLNEVVALTNHYKFLSVSNLNIPRPKQMPDLGLTEVPHSWDVLPAIHSLSGHLEIFCAINGTVYIIDQMKAQNQQIELGDFLRMSISPNGKFLALFSDDGMFSVVSTNFQENLANFKTNSESPPISLCWCGSDSVLLHWEDMLLMIGPSGDYLKFPYDGIVQLVAEIDSARIISSTKQEIIQKISSTTENIFLFGSTSPSAILFDARDHFDHKLSKADENIRSINLFLRQAVDDCIEAASFEHEPELQKSLLKTASFGKGFLENYPSAKLVDMNRNLRVLNSLRSPDIGIGLTYEQYQYLTPDRVVEILSNRRHYALAKSICEYLKLSAERLMIHWACFQVKESVEEEETISKLIFDKLSEYSGISYSEVAKEAFKAGRTKLATSLLEFESSPADQVPLLLNMQQDDLALQKAIESGDTDLGIAFLISVSGNVSHEE
jgi:hypothetical protein